MTIDGKARIPVHQPVKIGQFHRGKTNGAFFCGGMAQHPADHLVIVTNLAVGAGMCSGNRNRHDPPFHQAAIMCSRGDLLPDIASFPEIDGAKLVKPGLEHQRTLGLQVHRALRHTGSDAHSMPCGGGHVLCTGVRQ